MPQFETITATPEQWGHISDALFRTLCQVVEQVNLLPYAFHRLEERVNQVRVTTSSASTDVRGIDERVASFESKYQKFLEEVAQEREHQKSQINMFNDRFEQQRSFLMDVTERIDANDRRVRKDISRLNELFQSSQSSLAQHVQEVVGVKETVSHVTIQFAQLSAVMDNHNRGMNRIIESLPTKADVHELIETSVAPITESYMGLGHRVDQLHQYLQIEADKLRKEIKDAIAPVADDVLRVRTIMDRDLRTSITSLHEEINRLHKRCIELGDYFLVDKKNRSEIIQNELEKEIATQLDARVEHVNTQYSSVQEMLGRIESSLVDQVNKMNRRVARFQQHLEKINDEYPKLVQHVIKSHDDTQQKTVVNIESIMNERIIKEIEEMHENMRILESSIKKAVSAIPTAPPRISEARFYALEQRLRELETDSARKDAREAVLLSPPPPLFPTQSLLSQSISQSQSQSQSMSQSMSQSQLQSPLHSQSNPQSLSQSFGQSFAQSQSLPIRQSRESRHSSPTVIVPSPLPRRLSRSELDELKQPLSRSSSTFPEQLSPLRISTFAHRSKTPDL